MSSATPSPASTDAGQTPELRVGVVGLGFAGTTHLDAYTALPGAKVVALAGKETERLHELGESRCVEHLYEDWEDLVARDDLDIVSIGTPNALHHPIAIAALSSGKHVFSEKPLATTGELAEEMVAAARANDRVLDVAYNHRRRADVQWLRRYLDENSLGSVYHARASWMRRAGIPGLGSWFTSKEVAGGGPMIDLGSHVLDIALVLLDEPHVTSVSAVAYGELGRAGRGGRTTRAMKTSSAVYDVEDIAVALLRLDNGHSLELSASWASYSKDNEDITIELLGTTGGARIAVDDYSSEGTVTLYSDIMGTPTIAQPDIREPDGRHQGVIAEFLETVRSGAREGSYGEFALHRSRVIDAIYESAATKKEVAVR